MRGMPPSDIMAKEPVPAVELKHKPVKLAAQEYIPLGVEEKE
jgi:hypothetical protein